MSYLWDLEEYIGWGKILKSSYEGQATKGWLGPFFIWGVDSLEMPTQDFHLAIGGGLGCMKWLQDGGREKFYISYNFSCTTSFLVKILLAKLKNLYIQYARISIMKKQNSNQNVKFEKMVVSIKT